MYLFAVLINESDVSFKKNILEHTSFPLFFFRELDIQGQVDYSGNDQSRPYRNLAFSVQGPFFFGSLFFISSLDSVFSSSTVLQ